MDRSGVDLGMLERDHLAEGNNERVRTIESIGTLGDELLPNQVAGGVPRWYGLLTITRTIYGSKYYARL
jgi:hypothetical protein